MLEKVTYRNDRDEIHTHIGRAGAFSIERHNATAAQMRKQGYNASVPFADFAVEVIASEPISVEDAARLSLDD